MRKRSSTATSREGRLRTAPAGRNGGPGLRLYRPAMRAMAITAATLSIAGLCGLASPVHADTIGTNGLYVSAEDVFAAMGMIDYDAAYTKSTALFTYVRNDYIGVVIGFSGSSSVNQFNDTTQSASHSHAGMITIGNLKGSLIYNTDDHQALVGLNNGEDYTLGVPAGLGVWPIPGTWELGTGVITYDTSAYLRANVDGTIINVVGNDKPYTLGPRYNNGVFEAEAVIADPTTGTGNGTGTGTGTVVNPTNVGVVLRQEIRLYRATAQFHWTIRNTDTIAHQVTLRFALPIRGTKDFVRNIGYAGSTSQGTHAGFVFPDPLHGNVPSNLSETIPGASLPDVMNFYGQRYETDRIVDPPYASRLIFRNANGNLPVDPTLPTKVNFDDPINYLPSSTTFDPQTDRPVYESGLVAGIYYGPYNVAPGSSQEVYAYFGNGQPSENLKDDVVVAAESTESLGFNSAEASDSSIVGNTQLVSDTNLLAATEKKFLSPNPLVIYGDIYNRKIASPLTNVQLTNVNMSLILPDGLSFATNPSTNATDTASRQIGTMNGDTASTVQWYAQGDGDVFGTVTYQVAGSASEIGARTISRALTIPAIPITGLTGGAFQMIGLPFDFDPAISNNGDPAAIMNALAPSSLRDQRTFFYKYVPDPQNETGFGSYQVVNQVLRGFGYFYKPDVTRIAFLAGVMPGAGQADETPVTSDVPSTTGQLQIALARGWNIISNPYVYQLPLSYLRLVPTDSGTIGDAGNGGYTLLDAVNSGLVEGTIWSFDTATQSYNAPTDLSAATLDPWVGYFIKVTSPVVLVYTPPTQHNSVILSDPTTGTTPATRFQSLFTTRKVGVVPTNQNWQQQFKAVRSDGKGDFATMIGVNSNVKPTRAMLAKPPSQMNDYVYVGLVNGKSSTRYAQILKSPFSGTQTWTMEVHSDSDGSVDLQWPNLKTSVPRTVKLSIKDLATGQSYPLASRSSLKVNLTKGVSKLFEVTASPVNSTPLAITNLRSLNSASSRSIRGASYEFAFGLTQDAEVTGIVKTMSGREVARLSNSRAMNAGESHLSWNGRGADGSYLPPGPYQIHILATGSDGTKVPAVAMFMSLR